MCVVALALDCHPDWRLLLIGNRDEYHARASAPLARWRDAAHIIGGRDLVSGGSWLGISDEGRLAVVTNIRSAEGPAQGAADGPDPHKSSRGDLVSSWLRAGIMPPDDRLDDYNGFSLLALSSQEAALLTNRPGAMRVMLGQGVHSLSNGMPHEDWPRKERLAEALSGWLSDENSHDPVTLFTLLRPQDEAADSPIFIQAPVCAPVYGTRCSTVVAVDRAGHGWIAERRFDADGTQSGETTLPFRWPA